ncbi:MAG: YidC/Oxa1 family membrane protein insertase [Clostridia bacterium]|nr:YidC/Oxa1 family membrane protein insertase [Clostridia bacterium]
MSILSFIYDLIFGPLILLFDAVYSIMFRMLNNEGASIIALSLAINLLILPLYRRADAMQEEERVRLEKLQPGIDHIKKVFKGDERFMMLQTYYRQNHYKPYYALSGSISLLLEIPFFIAAFRFLSGLELLKGNPYGPIADLSLPDGLLHIAGIHINLLPILMTVINIVSGIIYTRGMPLKSKIQLYGMALIFLLLLYDSPSGLVFYWTLNNLFSLIKNVFYKIKNPKAVICAICTGLACVLLPAVLFFFKLPTPRIQHFVTAALIALLFPLPAYLVLRKRDLRINLKPAEKSDASLFLICCAAITVLTGLLIPSAVISASPAEFMDMENVRSPLRYIISSAALSAGTFLVWMNVFYRLASPSAQRIASVASVLVMGMSVVNYMFFGDGYGNMSSLLQYDRIFINTTKEYIVNAVALTAIAAVLYFIVKKLRGIVAPVCIAVCVAMLIMSCGNILTIQSGYKKLLNTTSAQSDSQSSHTDISLPLDKNGKNVIVLMLDRGISDFFPYIIEEKPEVKAQFAGFTYYPNTISYGATTLVGASGLYGGYEYIPEEMDKRTELSIKEKQDQALKVMPLLFSRNGYETTVCDPTYAGAQWYPDLSIYDSYPEIKKYITFGKFNINYGTEETDRMLKRNFYAYSLFRVSPVLMHMTMYNRGNYNQSEKSSLVQSIFDMYTASGGFDGKNSQFAKASAVLDHLPDLTSVTDTGRNTFLMMSNDTTHEPMMLQEPEYQPSDSVDNHAYEESLGSARTTNGQTMQFTNSYQLIHYQANMAAMMKLGRWFDYLREQGVYDNTKIIIVSDHGRHLDYLNNRRFAEHPDYKDVGMNDTMIFKSLLLVKDFGSTELTFDDTFMTNADTPTIAFRDTVENPVNPFTGKEISSEAKNTENHYIAQPGDNTIEDYDNDLRQYYNITWIGFKGDDTFDMSAWRIIGEELIQ